MEMERRQDIQEEILGEKNKKYLELVEDMNQDIKAIESIQKPLAIYKDEKEVIR